MIKYLFLFGYYTCVVEEKYTNVSTVLCRESEYHFVEPNLTINQWDKIELGDTLKINKKTLQIW